MDFPDSSQFVFVTCRKESQAFCKQEIGQNHPELSFAFSRPGLMTFRVGETSNWSADKPWMLKSIFARTFGWSLKMFEADWESARQQAQEWCEKFSGSATHVWRRAESLKNAESRPVEPFANIKSDWNQTAKPDQRVLDLIEVDPDRWLMGWHLAGTRFQRWPGGRPEIIPESEPISRAYFKTAEAVLWSQLPLRPGDSCVEIGAAPGGSSQYLLERGCQVVAVDPAELEPRLQDNPKLIHLKKRAKEVKKANLAGARWLFADLNVAPGYTLDSVEDIVGNQRLHIQGMILTLKLMDGIPINELWAAAERVKALQFGHVKIRQLAYNRNEICLAALRHKADGRVNRKRRMKPTSE